MNNNHICVPFLGFQLHTVCSNDANPSSADHLTSGHEVTTVKPPGGDISNVTKADTSKTPKPTQAATPTSAVVTGVKPTPLKPQENPTPSQPQPAPVSPPTTNTPHIGVRDTTPAVTTPSQPKNSPATAGTNGITTQTPKPTVTNSGPEASTTQPGKVASVGTTHTKIAQKVVTVSQQSVVHTTDTSKASQVSGGNPTGTIISAGFK